MQKCGQDTLKIEYLINFSWVRLEIPSLTCAIHRNKARAVGTSALFTTPAGAGVTVASVLLFVLYRAEVCWPSAETRARTPGGPQGFVTGTQPHLQPLNPYFPHLKTGIKILYLVFCLFELFHDPGKFSPPLQSAQLSSTSNSLGTCHPPLQSKV